MMLKAALSRGSGTIGAVVLPGGTDLVGDNQSKNCGTGGRIFLWIRSSKDF